jgi:hypothetical protein
MLLAPLLPRDLIRLPAATIRSALRHTTLVRYWELCWSRQKTAVNQLQGSHNSIVCLTNTVLHMRHCHSVCWGPVSHITSLAAGRPWIGHVRGPILVPSDFSLYNSSFFCSTCPRTRKLVAARVWLPLCGPSTSRMPC